MSNIVNVIGGMPKDKKRIADLEVGESGYTVPWAVQDGNLNVSFHVCKKGGTASLWVECVAPGKYTLEFETPEYRDIFGGIQ